MLVKQSTIGGLPVVQAQGELDRANREYLRREVERLAHREQAVGLDLEEVDFIDSAGAHMLGELSAELRASGKRLVVLKESSQVHRVLKMLTRAGLLQL